MKKSFWDLKLKRNTIQSSKLYLFTLFLFLICEPLQTTLLIERLISDTIQ